AAPALARSTAWVVTSSGRANMWARARAAVAIQASRGALRPAMARRTGTSVAMARSQAMRWAKLPLPKIRMSQAPAVCSARGREALAGGRLGSRRDLSRSCRLCQRRWLAEARDEGDGEDQR